MQLAHLASRLTLVGLLALACLLSFGCTRDKPEPSESSGASEEPPTHVELSEEAYRSAGIEVAPAGVQSIERALRVTGVLGFDEGRMSRVRAAIPGRITRMLVAQGDSVRDGQALAELESPDMALALSSYRSASAEADLREKEKVRGQTLFEGKAISRADLQQREAESVRALSALDEARQRLFLLGLTGSDLDRVTVPSPPGTPAVSGNIRAPMSGRVVERKAAPGQNVTPGEDLFVVADVNRLWLMLQITERDLHFVRKGQGVSVEIPSYPGESFEAAIDYVGDAVDPHTRTVPTRVVVNNRAGRLKAGMYADAVVRVDEAPSAVTVPTAAIARLSGHTEVFVATGPRQFERRTVEIGRATDDWTEILSGLSAGERIAVKGTFILKSEALKGTLAEEE